MHIAMSTVHAVSTVLCSLLIVHCAPSAVQRARHVNNHLLLFIRALYREYVRCTMYSAKCTLHCPFKTVLCTAYCTVYCTVYCSVYFSVYCTVYFTVYSAQKRLVMREECSVVRTVG